MPMLATFEKLGKSNADGGCHHKGHQHSILPMAIAREILCHQNAKIEEMILSVTNLMPISGSLEMILNKSIILQLRMSELNLTSIGVMHTYKDIHEV